MFYQPAPLSLCILVCLAYALAIGPWPVAEARCIEAFVEARDLLFRARRMQWHATGPQRVRHRTTPRRELSFIQLLESKRCYRVGRPSSGLGAALGNADEDELVQSSGTARVHPCVASG
jgi:hypothetical protein